MGVTYTSRLVYGLLYKAKRATRSVTKYNDDTGEPYQREIESIFYVNEIGESIPERYNDPIDIFFGDHYTGYYGGNIVYGVSVGSVDCESGLMLEIDESKLQHAKECLPDVYNRIAKLHLILEVG